MWVVHGLVDESYLGALTQLGMLATAGVTFAPMPSISKYAMSKEGIPSATFHMLILPYFTLWAQNFLWTVYGGLTGHYDIFRINLFATTVTFLYVAVLYFKAPQRESHIVCPLIALGVSILAMGAGLVCSLKDESMRVMIISWAAIAFNVFQVLSPTKAALALLSGPPTLLEGFPVALTVAGFVSASLWTQYSLLVGSLAYLIPNLLGVVCNAAQIAIVMTVFARANKQRSEALLDENAPTYDAVAEPTPWQAIDVPDMFADENDTSTSAASTPQVFEHKAKAIRRVASADVDGCTGGMPDL